MYVTCDVNFHENASYFTHEYSPQGERSNEGNMHDINKDIGLDEVIDGLELDANGPETHEDGPEMTYEPGNFEQGSTTRPSPTYTESDPTSPQGKLTNENSNSSHENVNAQAIPETRYPVRKNRGIPWRQY